MDQIKIFDEQYDDRPSKIGQSSIYYKNASSLLTVPNGFMGAYDYSLNPYSGCAFGCSYCYAAFFARDNEGKENWGYWVNVKENALQLLQKFRKKPLIDKSIYISSVTDPYQPVEKRLELTRQILMELFNYHKPRIVIQTRSPLVARDIDILKKFDVLQVNMTITTDSEAVRKVFEPFCPSNTLRLQAIKQVCDAGVKACITMTPLLPIDNINDFATSLKRTGVDKFIVQPFHQDRGKFTAGTREKAMDLFRQYNWNDEKYKEIERVLKNFFPEIGIGKDGFKPI
jgi:DNA repair photolyase